MGFLHPLEPLDLFYGSTLETSWSSPRLRPNRTGGRYRLGHGSDGGGLECGVMGIDSPGK